MVAVAVFLVVAVILLLAGVVGSIIPGIPGPSLSVIGVLLYWWSTGYTTPGSLFVATTVIVGVGTVVLDYVAGAVSARAAGVSTSTLASAALAGIVLFLITGPVGVVLGVAAAVFFLELYRTQEVEESFRSAIAVVVGVVASMAVQVLVTLSILIGFLLVVV